MSSKGLKYTKLGSKSALRVSGGRQAYYKPFGLGGKDPHYRLVHGPRELSYVKLKSAASWAKAAFGSAVSKSATKLSKKLFLKKKKKDEVLDWTHL